MSGARLVQSARAALASAFGLRSVRYYGARGDGSTSDAAAFAALPDGEYRVPAGTYLIDASATVQERVSLTLAPGAVLSVASGQTLTILGRLSAPTEQIFSGSGAVKLGKLAAAQGSRPEWFGAVPDDIAVDSSTAIEKAAAALSTAGGGRVQFSVGTYYVKGVQLGSLTYDGFRVPAVDNVHYQGRGRGTVIQAQDDAVLQILAMHESETHVYSGLRFSHMAFRNNSVKFADVGAANGAGGYAIWLYTFNDLEIDHCWFYNNSYGAFVGANHTGVVSEKLRFHHNTVDGDNLVSALGVKPARWVRDWKVYRNRFRKVARGCSMELGGNDPAQFYEDVDISFNRFELGAVADVSITNTGAGVHLGTNNVAGQYIRGVTVAHNTFVNNATGAGAGSGNEIYIAGFAAAPVENITVEGNTSVGFVPEATSVDALIYLAYCKNGTVTSNTLTNPTGSVDYGVRLTGCEDLVVGLNRVQGANFTYAIHSDVGSARNAYALNDTDTQPLIQGATEKVLGQRNATDNDWALLVDTLTLGRSSGGRVVVNSSGVLIGSGVTGANNTLLKDISDVRTVSGQTALAAGATRTWTFAFVGATNGHECGANPLGGLDAGLGIDCVWATADAVNVRVRNYSSGSITPADRNWRVWARPRAA